MPIRCSPHTHRLLSDLIASFPFYCLSCGFGEGCAPDDINKSVFPVFVLLCGLRVTKIYRSPSARVLLLFPPGGNGTTRVSRNSGALALVRLGIIFLWLSHAAGWYSKSTSLEA